MADRSTRAPEPLSSTASVPVTRIEGGARATGPLRRRALAGFAVTLLIGLVVGRFMFLGDDAAPDRRGPPSASTDVAGAAAALASDPQNPAAATRLAVAYLAEARRTADPTLYAKADELILRSRSAAPEELPTLVAAGLLALARHDFPGALALAEEAKRIAPLAVDPLGIEVDALVELGRYDDAAGAADEMVRRRPDVASLSRVSYVLELRGEREAALEAMQQAVAAASAGSADRAYVLSLLGDLEMGRGRLDAAEDAYRRSLREQRGQAQAELGLARVLAERGDLPAAADALSRLTERIPLPDAVALFGDVLATQGDAAGAERQYALVRAIEALNSSAGGVQVDLELARFEVSQVGRAGGDADRAVGLARRARDARPTVYADDILAWSLRRAGRPSEALAFATAAVRTDIGDSTLWWHLAAVEADLGDLAAAREHLSRAIMLGGSVPLLERNEAAALATRLGVASP